LWRADEGSAQTNQVRVEMHGVWLEGWVSAVQVARNLGPSVAKNSISHTRPPLRQRGSGFQKSSGAGSTLLTTGGSKESYEGISSSCGERSRTIASAASMNLGIGGGAWKSGMPFGRARRSQAEALRLHDVLN
jgi:hypothetical protein